MDTEVPVSSTGMVTPSSACQPVLSSLHKWTLLLQHPGSLRHSLRRYFSSAVRCKLALDFIQLSHQEALFRMGAQATGHEKATGGHPDHSTDKCDEATRHSGKVAWLDTNSLLFCHALEYQNDMIELITRSWEAIQALHECIWKVVHQVMESAGRSVVDGLGIALRLVDMLPTIPLQLTFNTVTAGLPGYTPEAHAHTLPPGTN